MALRSTEMHFSSGVGRNLREDREAAAEEIVPSFQGLGAAAGRVLVTDLELVIREDRRAG